jgi:hypothetical protein
MGAELELHCGMRSAALLNRQFRPSSRERVKGSNAFSRAGLVRRWFGTKSASVSCNHQAAEVPSS